MTKIKLTKGELKRQRDCLQQYERYLPTLQLKKQQLQLEILWQVTESAEKKHNLEKKKQLVLLWAGLLADFKIPKTWLSPTGIVTTRKNVAGVELVVFTRAEFPVIEYDLFTTPLWLDYGLEALKEIIYLQKEIEIIEEGIALLRRQLRVATQRVNLFEKIKIPEAQEAIRLIKIYIGDQMSNSVGRSKIAKKKIEKEVFNGAAA